MQIIVYPNLTIRISSAIESDKYDYIEINLVPGITYGDGLGDGDQYAALIGGYFLAVAPTALTPSSNGWVRDATGGDVDVDDGDDDCVTISFI